jgi:cytochrome c oxidase subunit 4
MADAQNEIHVTPLKVYLMVGVLLFILTGITVTVSKIHLGPWNAVVALAIASIKGLLVVLFFMHLLYDKKIYALVVSTALVILAIFIALTMADVLRRGDIYENQASPINHQAKIYKQDSSISTAPQGQIEKESTDSSQHEITPDSTGDVQPGNKSANTEKQEMPKPSGGTGH